MEVSMWEQAGNLLYAVWFGAICGILYDILRIVRVLHGVRYPGRFSAWLSRLRLPFLPEGYASPRPTRYGKRVQSLLIFLGDFLYLLLVGMLFSVFIYWQNDGVFRFYMLFGATIGYMAYYFTVGRLVLASAEAVAAFLRILLAYLVMLVRIPIGYICRCLWYLLYRLYRMFVYIAGRVETLLLVPMASRRIKRRMLAEARNGCFDI